MMTDAFRERANLETDRHTQGEAWWKMKAEMAIMCAQADVHHRWSTNCQKQLTGISHMHISGKEPSHPHPHLGCPSFVSLRTTQPGPYVPPACPWPTTRKEKSICSVLGRASKLQK